MLSLNFSITCPAMGGLGKLHNFSSTSNFFNILLSEVNTLKHFQDPSKVYTSTYVLVDTPPPSKILFDLAVSKCPQTSYYYERCNQYHKYGSRE